MDASNGQIGLKDRLLQSINKLPQNHGQLQWKTHSDLRFSYHVSCMTRCNLSTTTDHYGTRNNYAQQFENLEAESSLSTTFNSVKNW